MIGLPSLDEMLVPADGTLRDALTVIEKNAQGVCFAVRDRVVTGVLSDGDVRRALLVGTALDTPIARVVKPDFVVLPVGTPHTEIQAHLGAGVRHIPIVDDAGRVVDYACAYRYHQVPLVQPMLDGNELEYVTECIRTGWISSQGRFVREFEESFGRFVGTPNAVVTSNGTVALHLALVALGIGPGDEVIVPDLTFAAPVNAVLYVGATPVLVDVDPVTMAMDMDAAERAIGPRTRAIIPVHLYGHPADMGRVTTLAARHGLIVVEDCAEALGSRWRGQHVGLLGDAATFSFFGNKTITTGEGGMLLFKDPAVLERARILRDHGMSKTRRYWHLEIGYNYRMTNVQAAIGLAQMERAEHFVARKRWVAVQYRQRLDSVPGLRLPGEVGDVVNSYWLYTVVLPAELARLRDPMLELIKENGVEVRPVFHSMHRMPPYHAHVREGQRFPGSIAVSDGGISLPSGVNMSESDIDKVARVLTEVIARSRVSAP